MISDIATLITYKCLLEPLAKRLKEFIANDVPDLIKNKEKEMNQKLIATDSTGFNVGDDFLGGKISNITPGKPGEDLSKGSVFIYFNEKSGTIKMPDLSGLPEISKLKLADLKSIKGIETGFSYSKLSVTIEIDRKINITNSSEHPFRIKGITEYSVEITKNSGKISLSIGYAKIKTFDKVGSENGTTGTTALVRFLYASTPAFGLYGFIGTSSNKGIIIKLGTTGINIRLGATGCSITGISALYGEKWAPDINKVTKVDPVDELTLANPMDIVTWVRMAEKDDLTAWAPSRRDTRVYGLAATLGDTGTSGRLIQLTKLGVMYISVGPIIIIGGELSILNKEGVLDTPTPEKSSSPFASVIGMINIKSGIVFLRADVSFQPINAFKELTINGTAEFQASSKNIADWYFAATGSVSVPWFNINGGLKVTSTNLTLTGGVYQLIESEIFGLKVIIEGSLSVKMMFGWNPIQVDGTLNAYLAFGIRIFGKDINLKFYLDSNIKFPAPKKLKLSGGANISMPWPIPDISIEFTIFDYQEALETPKPETNLQLPEKPTKIATLHPPSGLSGELNYHSVENPVSDQNPISRIWPDTEFVIPFKRIAYDPSGKIPSVNENLGYYPENGGITVRHIFSYIKLFKINIKDNTEIEINDFNGYWRDTAVANGTSSTSTLQIPSSNPLSWLNSFDYAVPSQAVQMEYWQYQYFGIGPAEVIEFTKYTLPPFTIETSKGFNLINLSIFDGGRAAVFKNGFKLFFRFLNDNNYEQFRVRAVSVLMICSITGNFPKSEISAIDENGNELLNASGDINTKVSFITLRILADDTKLVSCTVETLDGTPMRGIKFKGNSEEGLYTSPILGFGYLPFHIQSNSDHQIVLSPGRYRLALSGSSIARLREGGKDNTTPWAPVNFTFDVELPTQLRPYILYSTFGDERIFKMPWQGWYPSPFGMGLPRYQDHLCTIRFRVHYMQKIYAKLFIKHTHLESGIESEDIAEIKTSKIARHQFTKVPWEWMEKVGILKSPSEVEFNPEKIDNEGAGIYKVQIGWLNPEDEMERVNLDEWNYIKSKYKNPESHLTPITPQAGPPADNGCVSGLYGRFGFRKYITKGSPNFTKLQTLPVVVNYIFGWALSDKIFSVEPIAAKASLSYFNIFEKCRVFSSGNLGPFESPLEPSLDSKLSLLINDREQAIALIFKSDEPVDWRRVKATALYSDDIDSKTSSCLKFDVRILPSPDGCGAALVLEAERIPVRMPNGAYKITVEYHCGIDGLPVLRNKNNPDNGEMVNTVDWSFYQNFGEKWRII